MMDNQNCKLSFTLILLLGGILVAFGQTYTPYTPPPNSPLANHEHPRLYFTQSSLPTIKNYIDNYESSDFQTFINEVDGAYSEAPSGKDRNYLILDGNSYAFLSYVVTSGLFSNYSFAHTGSEYAQKAIQHAVEMSNQIFSGQLHETTHAGIFSSSGQGGWVNLSLGVIYDWCYSYLTLAEKQLIADTFIFLFNNRDSNVNPGEYIKLGLKINASCHDVGVGGMAMWGDPLGSQYTTVVQDMLNGLQWLWFDRVYYMGEQLFENTAGWSEGPDYLGGSSTTILWYTAALSSAIGINLVDEISWLHDTPKYKFFYVLPMPLTGQFPGYYEQRNDASSLRDWEKKGTLQQITPVASYLKYSDPDYAGFYRWIVEDSQYKFTSYSYDNEEPRLYWLMYKFLWGIKDIAKKSQSQVGLKNSYRFGLGDTILKSDQTTQDATKINFYTPKYHLPRHFHKDFGSFVIFKHGTLALDAGVSKSNSNLPKSNKSRMPIYHNVMALYQPNGDVLYDHNLDSNSKADAYYDSDNQPGGANHVGNVVALKFEPGIYDFADYDYTRAYKGETFVNRIGRKLLYIRDPNTPNYSDQEYVLLFDDVDVTDPAIKRRWLIHTPYQPQITDGSWNLISSGFWKSNTGSILDISNTFANAHGKLFVKFLAPNSFEFRMRGGSEGGNDYWFTDAEGNDLTVRGPFTDWGAFWAGSYRVEVEDLSGGNTSQYLAVMQIGDSNTLSTMASVEKITTGDFIGAFINKDRIAFFNKTQTPATAITYSFSSNKTVRHFITGLQQGYYDVKQNGTFIYNLNVDQEGVLYFEHSGSGNFTITIGVAGTVPVDIPITNFQLQQNYPNPFNPSTTITYTIPNNEFVNLIIYDTSGRMIQTLVNKNQTAGTYNLNFDAGSGMASGVYFYILKAGGFSITKKMVLMR